MNCTFHFGKDAMLSIYDREHGVKTAGTALGHWQGLNTAVKPEDRCHCTHVALYLGSNLCSVYIGLLRSSGKFLDLWHDLAAAWIASSQMMWKYLNLSYLWPAVDVNNACVWATQPNSLCGQLRKITAFRLWSISSKSWWALLFTLPNSLHWIKEALSVCLKWGHVTWCLELAGIIFNIYHGSCALLF